MFKVVGKRISPGMLSAHTNSAARPSVWSSHAQMGRWPRGVQRNKGIESILPQRKAFFFFFLAALFYTIGLHKRFSLVSESYQEGKI